jgi:hypothetical protein
MTGPGLRATADPRRRHRGIAGPGPGLRTTADPSLPPRTLRILGLPWIPPWWLKG